MTWKAHFHLSVPVPLVSSLISLFDRLVFVEGRLALCFGVTEPSKDRLWDAHGASTCKLNERFFCISFPRMDGLYMTVVFRFQVFFVINNPERRYSTTRSH